MANRRIERLNEQLRREISDILRRDVRDPRVGIPTVTRVEVTPDFWVARVFVRLVGTEDEKKEAVAGLEAAAPFVRRALGGLRMRRVPEIRFESDTTLEHATRIEELLRDNTPVAGWVDEPDDTDDEHDDEDDDEDEDDEDEDEDDEDGNVEEGDGGESEDE